MSVIDKKKWLLFPVSVCLMAAGWSSGILSSDTGCSYKAFHYEAAEVYAKNAENTTESGDNTSAAEEIDTAEASNVETQRVPVEMVLQNPALPNGCESASLAMILTAAGFPADALTLYQTEVASEGFTFAEGRLYGPDPEEVYVGDAESAEEGWYCFEGPILQAGDDWIAKNGGGARMEQISGLAEEELDTYLTNGIPAAVWVTLYYGRPVYSETFSWTLSDGSTYIPYTNLHCVVITGEENGEYQIADPLSGWQTVDKEIFWNSFDAVGCRAVIVNTGEI